MIIKALVIINTEMITITKIYNSNYGNDNDFDSNETNYNDTNTNT